MFIENIRRSSNSRQQTEIRSKSIFTLKILTHTHTHEHDHNNNNRTENFVIAFRNAIQ